jgi:hypothetical protein
MEDLAEKQGGLYREIGIFLRPATGSGLGRAPCSERLFGEPDRDIATLAQGLVIFGPVSHFVTRVLNLVTAALVMFVRYRLFCRWNPPRIMPDRPPSGRKGDLFNNAHFHFTPTPLSARLRPAIRLSAPPESVIDFAAMTTIEHCVLLGDCGAHYGGCSTCFRIRSRMDKGERHG